MPTADDRTRWIKFEPTDWLRDRPLHQCSLAARGLWIDMLCIMATPGLSSEHFGYLANVAGNSLKPLTVDDLAWEIRATPKDIEIYLKELEAAGVFSRTEEGVIYSRRMVKDRATFARQSANGRKGWSAPSDGVAAAQGPKQRAPKAAPNMQDLMTDKTRQDLQDNSTRAKVDKEQVFDRLCALAKIDLAKLHKHPAWMQFPGSVVGWIAAGCDPERDIWPTIERLLLTATSFPASPNYFAKAVLEARDKRRLTPEPTQVIEWTSKWTEHRPVRLSEVGVQSLIKDWARGVWGPWQVCGRMPTDPLCDLPDSVKAQLLAARSEPGRWVGDRPEGYA